MSSPRTRVIVNPAAGQGRVRQHWPRLYARLLRLVPRLTVRWTSAPGDATAFTRTALRNGVDRIVTVGGDGTLHEVVNGFFAADGSPISPSACLTPLPFGTGNDFQRSLVGGHVLNTDAFLKRCRIRPVDLLYVTYTTLEGQTAHRYALNVASFGLSGRVVRRLHTGVQLPGRGLRYLGALLRALVTHRPVPVAFSVDDTPLATCKVHLGAIANGHTFGAGLQIAPDAVLDDGLLDVTMVHDHPVSTLLPRLPHFYRGTHPSLRAVSTYRGRRFTARPLSRAPVWVEADGELLGRLPISVRIAPSRLRMQG